MSSNTVFKTLPSEHHSGVRIGPSPQTESSLYTEARLFVEIFSFAHALEGLYLGRLSQTRHRDQSK